MDIINIEWRVVQSAQHYEINQLGEIRNIRLKKIRRPVKQSGRYHRVNAYSNGTLVCLMVHREVAKAFVPNPLNKPMVCHIDGDMYNNCANNLKWGTALENCADSIKHGTRARGEKLSKYKRGIVAQIRCLALIGVSDCEIGRMMKIPHPTVRDIRRGRSWKEGA